ncbi:MAG: MBL fold metallo-hydrolase, partial [Chloroflexota bacterium]
MTTTDTKQQIDLVTEIASDIYRVSIPIPLKALGNINCYLIQNETGWAIFDTAMNTPVAQQAWPTALSSLGLTFADIEQIIITHTHPDHCGLAGWLQQQIKAATGQCPPIKLSVQGAE